LIETLKDECLYVRICAAGALGSIGLKTEAALAALQGAANDPATWLDRTITCNCLSKTFAMTGWRIGYTAGPKSLVSAMNKLQSQMTSNITSFCMPAIVEAYSNPNSKGEIEKMRSAFEKRGAPDAAVALFSSWRRNAPAPGARPAASIRSRALVAPPARSAAAARASPHGSQ
jgi:hypothetical protein